MTVTQDLITQIGSLSYFSDLSSLDLKTIIESGSIEKYLSGKTIVKEGVPCSGLFILIFGEVYLKKIGPEGQYHTMKVLTPISMFNEVAVLDQGDNPASAITGRDSTIWRIDQDKFLNSIKENSSLAVKLLYMMAKRNRSLLSQYEDISFLTVHDRLAKLLLELSNHGDNIIIREKHTITELAERIGTVPEVLCRALKLLKDQELIESSRSIIKINSADILSKIGSGK